MTRRVVLLASCLTIARVCSWEGLENERLELVAAAQTYIEADTVLGQLCEQKRVDPIAWTVYGLQNPKGCQESKGAGGKTGELAT